MIRSVATHPPIAPKIGLISWEASLNFFVKSCCSIQCSGSRPLWLSWTTGKRPSANARKCLGLSDIRPCVRRDRDEPRPEGGCWINLNSLGHLRPTVTRRCSFSKAVAPGLAAPVGMRFRVCVRCSIRRTRATDSSATFTRPDSAPKAALHRFVRLAPVPPFGEAEGPPRLQLLASAVSSSLSAYSKAGRASSRNPDRAPTRVRRQRRSRRL